MYRKKGTKVQLKMNILVTIWQHYHWQYIYSRIGIATCGIYETCLFRAIKLKTTDICDHSSVRTASLRVYRIHCRIQMAKLQRVFSVGDGADAPWKTQAQLFTKNMERQEGNQTYVRTNKWRGVIVTFRWHKLIMNFN